MTDQSLTAACTASSFLQGHNADYIEQLRPRYADNPGAPVGRAPTAVHTFCGIALLTARRIATAMVCLGFGPTTVHAQVPIYTPCLNATGDPAVIEAAFVAAGWTPITEPAERTAALWTIGEAEYMVVYIPPTPPDAAALNANMADARGRAEFTLKDQSLFRLGTTVAVFYFPTSPDMRNLKCQFSGPLLPEVEAALMPDADVKAISDILFISGGQSKLPLVNAQITIDVMRYVPPFPADPPITGLDTIFVRISSGENF